MINTIFIDNIDIDNFNLKNTIFVYPVNKAAFESFYGSEIHKLILKLNEVNFDGNIILGKENDVTSKCDRLMAMSSYIIYYSLSKTNSMNIYAYGKWCNSRGTYVTYPNDDYFFLLDRITSPSCKYFTSDTDFTYIGWDGMGSFDTISDWNKTIRATDEVYHLGNFGTNQSKLLNDILNFSKFKLIPGNKDPELRVLNKIIYYDQDGNPVDNRYLSSDSDRVFIHNKSVTIQHYPNMNNKIHRDFYLFGHVDNVLYRKNGMNVNYKITKRFIHEDEVYQLMNSSDKVDSLVCD